jgi:UDP-glucose:(heptosyl)LPS alpha-1,3-glucosyltransferase
MDIALVVRRFGRRGGVALYTAELARWLSRGHTVTVYAATWEEDPGGNLRFVRVPFLTSGYLARRRKHAANTLVELASFMRSAPGIVGRGHHDIVHNQGDSAGTADVLTAHSCHKAWLEQARRDSGSTAERIRKSSANPLHALILHTERIGVTRSKRVIAISQRVRTQMLEHYRIPEERIVVIPNGVDTVRFSPANRSIHRDAMRREFGIASDELVAILPAHEFRRKGLAVLIESMGRLGGGLRLVVVGRDDPGPFLPSIRSHGLEERIRFVGDSPAIERWYAAADMMLLPTLFEAFGLVITEAMASGLPVVTSRDAGAAELIADEEEGLLLDDPTDAEEVARAIRRLQDDPGLRERIGAAARRRAAFHSWDRIAAMTLELYETVAREKRSA